MGAKSVDRQLEGFGKGDEVAAPSDPGGDARAQTGRCGLSRIARVVERGYTQSRPPRISGHKSIRIQEPIRFAEMRGIQKFRRGRMKMLCPPQSLIGRTMQVGELLPPYPVVS